MAQLMHTLLAAAVHENKNLMQEVLGAIDALAEHPEAAGLQDEIIALRRLAKRLVDGSLEVLAIYNRGQDGDGLKVNYNTVTLKDFMQEVLDETVDMLRGRALSVQVLMDDSLPAYWIFDAGLVMLALRNGIENAIEFAQSQLQVICSLDGERLCISVEDDGLYFGKAPPEKLARPVATGLGVKLADKLLRSHHDDVSGRWGEVQLTASTRLGGAAFRCLLP